MRSAFHAAWKRPCIALYTAEGLGGEQLPPTPRTGGGPGGSGATATAAAGRRASGSEHERAFQTVQRAAELSDGFSLTAFQPKRAAHEEREQPHSVRLWKPKRGSSARRCLATRISAVGSVQPL